MIRAVHTHKELAERTSVLAGSLVLSRIPSHIVMGCFIFNTHPSLCWTIQLLFRKTQLGKRNHAVKMYGKRTQKPFCTGRRVVTSSQDGIISNCFMVAQTILLVLARLQTPWGSNQHHLSLCRCQEASYIQQTVSLGQKPDHALHPTLLSPALFLLE